MLKVGVLASGRGSNFQSIIDSIDTGRIKAEVSILIVDKPEAYAIERAKKHCIPFKYMNPGDHASGDSYYEAIASEMKAHGVGLVVLAGFMRIVRAPLLAAFPMSVMNIHPALLPSFAGLHGHRDALNYGVKISGCTVHFVDEGMDTGPVIIQAAVPLYDDDTESSLSERILEQEHRIYPEAIGLFAQGRLRVEGRRVVVTGGRRPGDYVINPPIET